MNLLPFFCDIVWGEWAYLVARVLAATPNRFLQSNAGRSAWLSHDDVVVTTMGRPMGLFQPF